MNTIMDRLAGGQFVLLAEIGVNYYDIAAKLHISIMEAAKMMILEARNAGIHGVKFQTYKAETLASKNSPSYWDTSEEPTVSQYELFKKFDAFGVDEYKELAGFCEQVGIEFCSTPFDLESVDYLEPLMSVYKISSSDLNDIPFIEAIAKKNKPILLSTGASNLDEIKNAVAAIRKYNGQKLTLLHCVLEYPTPYSHANLEKISSLKNAFPDAYIGYSDHTKPDADYDVVQTAYLLGAQIVEKHFTLDKSLRGNDHYHAMDVRDAEEILRRIAFTDVLRGSGKLAYLDSEQTARANARRSLVLSHNMRAGTEVRREDLTFKRPGVGIAPSEIDKVIGMRVKCDLMEDTVLDWNMLV